jgi:hypothetical protein
MMNRKTTAVTLVIVLALVSSNGRPRAQTGPRSTFTAGWATFGQVLPPGAANDGLDVIGPLDPTGSVAPQTLQTQADVKSRWPDNSIKFAVVTARIPSAGDYQIVASPTAAGASILVPNEVRLSRGGGSRTPRDLKKLD